MPRPIKLTKPGTTAFMKLTASQKAKAAFRKLVKTLGTPKNETPIRPVRPGPRKETL